MSKSLKYPRTPHFSFSPGATSDDKFVESDFLLEGKRIVITEKMDGENISIYKDKFHARSLDSPHSHYHSWLANFISSFQYLMDDDLRICGEYLYVKHSIGYDNLKSYFCGFSCWKNNLCLDWNTTIDIFNRLSICSVPILYVGKFDMNKIKDIAHRVVCQGGEGIVVRNFDNFDYNDFSLNVIKYVRQNHVQTDKHWKTQVIVLNKLG